VLFTDLNRLTQVLEMNLPATGTTARRLWHGRGGTIPELSGLTLDWYPPLLHLICYHPISDRLAAQLAEWLGDKLDPAPAGLILQCRDLPESPQHLAWGKYPEKPLATESGLRFLLRFDRGQNIGFFPDMATGRSLVRNQSADKKVLNLFAYTCSLSVAALAGKAESVTNLDMSRNALAWGRENHQLNDLDDRRVTYLAHDLFKSFGKLGRLGPFDLLIADPPDTQGNSFKPERDWPKLLKRLPELLAPGGEFIGCISPSRLGRSFLEQLMAVHAPELLLLAGHTAGADFPEKYADKGLHLLHYRRPD
jgi:23S rRNA (cytosine1962-C5)-methyltransferase